MATTLPLHRGLEWIAHRHLRVIPPLDRERALIAPRLIGADASSVLTDFLARNQQHKFNRRRQQTLRVAMR